MNSVIISIGLILYILNSKYKMNSIYLITRFHEQRDNRYWTIMIYFEFKIWKYFNIINHEVPWTTWLLYWTIIIYFDSKHKIILICLITRFHEQRDYKYWTNIIYILNSKYKINSIYLIKRFHEQRNYRYWTIKIYFNFKI